MNQILDKYEQRTPSGGQPNRFLFPAFALAVAALVGAIAGGTLVVSFGEKGIGPQEVVMGYVAFFLLALLLLIPVAIVAGVLMVLLARFRAERRWRSPLFAIIVGLLVSSIPLLMGILSLSPLRSYALFAVAGIVGGLLYWWLMIARYPELRHGSTVGDQGEKL